jgi:glycerol-1-phosphate dehydrogenase [NAD(P)+]
MTDDGILELRDLLQKHGTRRDLDLHLVERVEEAPALFQAGLVHRKWAVVADETTQRLAGTYLASALNAPLLRIPGRAGGAVVAGRAEADRLTRQLQTSGAEAVVAVGAGSLNDLTKFASQQLSIGCAVLATAPSMNGYTSAGAALLEGGVKLSVPCAPPRITVAPIGLLCQAPARMIAAGYGDLRSRPVSGADWYLSHRLLGTPYAAEALGLIDEADRVAAAAVDGLATRSPAAIANLTTGLLLSGMAMDIVGTSAPASGGEHLVSHYLDMFHFSCGGPHDLHGCQVGVATLALASLYERLLKIDIHAVQAPTHEPWTDLAERLASHFGPLWSAVEPIARQVHGDDEARQDRLETLRLGWAETTTELRRILGPNPTCTEQLQRAGAPIHFADLGVSPEQTRAALLHARFVRARYTVLDLAAELGLLDSWVDDLLATSHL